MNKAFVKSRFSLFFFYAHKGLISSQKQLLRSVLGKRCYTFRKSNSYLKIKQDP